MGDLNILRPSTKKVFIFSLLKSLIATTLIALIVMFFHYLDILTMFLEIAETFGLNIEGSTILLYGLVLLFILLGGYIGYKSLIFTKNNIQITPNGLIINKAKMFDVKSTNVPYGNIQSISYDDKGFGFRLFRSSKITFLLTGMDIQNIDVEFIEDSQQNVVRLQELLTKFKANMYQEVAETKRIDTIMEKF